MQRKPLIQQLYFWVLVAMVLGVLFGQFCPKQAITLHPLALGFIKLIRMVIAPIIFCTVVVGIAGMGNLNRVGRIGFKAILYFEVMTTVALAIGWLVGHLFQPGAGMNANITTLDVSEIQQTLANVKAEPTAAEFFLNIIPKSLIGAFADNEIIQVLFISVLFGVSIAGLGAANQPVIYALDQISKALMRMIAIIIKLAPIAVFGAMSYTISRFGLESLRPLSKLLAGVYLSCLFFVFGCLGTLLRLNGISIWKFVRYIREELFIVFGTASSEPVLPRMMVKLEALGCSKPMVGLVLPAGYSFNLDGSSIYITMAALFIAQATNTHLTLGQELAVFVVSLLTSKGAATVVGSAFITLAATLTSMKTIPVEGMVLILGVDWFMALARAMTNLVGNGVATIVIARWENDFDAATAAKVLNGAGRGNPSVTPLPGEYKQTTL